MSAREDKERSGRETKPGPLPETTPPVFPGPNYDFILQCVFEMQKTVGQLTQAVNTLLEAAVVSQNDLSILLSKAPRNCWLALNEEETSVVGRGETMAEAVKEANTNGVQDPIVIWAPKTWGPAIYLTGTAK